MYDYIIIKNLKNLLLIYIIYYFNFNFIKNNIYFKILKYIGIILNLLEIIFALKY